MGSGVVFSKGFKGKRTNKRVGGRSHIKKHQRTVSQKFRIITWYGARSGRPLRHQGLVGADGGISRPDASRARGIDAVRWWALSGRNLHFIRVEGMGLGWRSSSEAQPGTRCVDSLLVASSRGISIPGRSAHVDNQFWRRHGAQFTMMASRALKIHCCTWRGREAICLRCVCDRV